MNKKTGGITHGKELQQRKQFQQELKCKKQLFLRGIRTRMLPGTAIPVQKCLTVKTAAEIRMRTTSQTVTEKRADSAE